MPVILPFSPCQNRPNLPLYLLDGEDREAVESLGTSPLPACLAGAWNLHGVFLLSVRAVAVGVGRAHEHDRFRAESCGEVDGAGVAAEDDA